MTMPKTVAGKWGPIAFAIGPVNMENLSAAVECLNTEKEGVWAAAEDKYQQYLNAHDRGNHQVSRSLWSEYMELSREFMVLLGWYRMISAACDFAEHGCRSSYLSDVREIELVEMSD